MENQDNISDKWDQSTIGELLVKEGLLTEDQLERALQIQKEDKSYMPLRQVCLTNKLILSADLTRVIIKY